MFTQSRKPTVAGLLVVLATSIFILVVILLTVFPSSAAPIITWELSKVVETVAWGQEKTTTVSFISDKDLSNIAIYIVPELKSYVTANPSSFASISGGERITITLIFSAPYDGPVGPLDGTLHLQAIGKGKRTYGRPLPVTLIVFAVEGDPEGVIDAIVSNLRDRDIEAVLPDIAPSLHDQLRGLDSASLANLATSLENRRLIEETPTLRIYVGPWIDQNGSQRDVEFTLALTELGDWKIIAW